MVNCPIKGAINQKEEGIMVSIVNRAMTEYIGLSTDTKPSGNMVNGSSFYEMDTGDTYYWDADGEEWAKPGAEG